MNKWERLILAAAVLLICAMLLLFACEVFIGIKVRVAFFGCSILALTIAWFMLLWASVKLAKDK